MNQASVALFKRLRSCISRTPQSSKPQPCNFPANTNRSYTTTSSAWASVPGPTPMPFLSKKALRTRKIMVVSVTAICVAPLVSSARFYSVEKAETVNNLVDRDKKEPAIASENESDSKERGTAPISSEGTRTDGQADVTKTERGENSSWKVISPIEVGYPIFNNSTSGKEKRTSEKQKEAETAKANKHELGNAKNDPLEAPWETEATGSSKLFPTKENDQNTVAKATSPSQLLSKESPIKETVKEKLSKEPKASEAKRESSIGESIPSKSKTHTEVEKNSGKSVTTPLFGHLQSGTSKEDPINYTDLKNQESIGNNKSPTLYPSKTHVLPAPSTLMEFEKESERSRPPEKRPSVSHVPKSSTQSLETLVKNATKRNAPMLFASLSEVMKQSQDKSNSKSGAQPDFPTERPAKKKPSIMQVTTDYFSSIGGQMGIPSIPIRAREQQRQTEPFTVKSSLTASPNSKPVGLPVRETLAINSSEVHICSLPWDYTEEDVAKLCSKFGAVFHCHMETDADGFLKGSALVTMENQRAALLVVEGLQNMILEESFRLQVMISDRTLSPPPAVRGTRNVIRVEPLPPNVSSRELAEHVAVHGTVLACSIPTLNGRNTRYGLVAMLTAEDAKKAIRNLNRTRFQMSTIKLTMLSPSSNESFPLRTISIRSGRMKEKIYLDRLLVTEDITLVEALEIARIPTVTPLPNTRLVARTEYGDQIPFRRPLSRLITDQTHIDLFLTVEEESPFDWNAL